MNTPESEPTRVGVRLLAAVVAIAAGVAAVLIALLLLQGTLT
jgi:hypothetical protein